MKLFFDKGTIVFESTPSFCAVELPAVRWDARIQAYRAPASAHARIRGALFRAGIFFEDRAHRPERPEATWTSPTLRPYQREALAAWERAARCGIVALPTGSGKTQLAVAAVASVGRATLCLVPTRVLLEQWQRELARAYGGDIGCFGGGARRFSPITVATLASARAHLAHIGDRFDLLVTDEVHHAPGYEEVFAMTTAAARLGLTATPPRDPDAAETLSRLVGPVVYARGLGELAGPFLAPFDIKPIELELTASERARYDREMEVFRDVFLRYRKRRPDAGWADFARAAERSDEGLRALAAWRRAKGLRAYTEQKRKALGELLARHEDSRVVVFTADNASAYAIAREHLIMPITCDIGKGERQEALARFRAGDLRALVSARVLNEGVDMPRADVAIIVGGSLGEREHVQRIGRVLRPAAEKRAVVYELITRRTAEVGQRRRRSIGVEEREHFRLWARCGVGERSRWGEIRSGDPIFPGEAPRRYDSRPEERFARDFAKAAPDWDIIREPEPVAAGDALIFPDFALEHRRSRRRWLLEIVGFWTPEYLDNKLASLRRARADNLIVCIGETRNCAFSDLPHRDRVVRFRKRLDPSAVLALLDAPTPCGD